MSTFDLPDTIFAVATGAARAAVSIIRVSGSRAHDVAGSLAGRLPAPRMATFARLRDPTNGEVLDDALLLVFDAAKSELGEDGAEFHLHGSLAVVAAVLRVLAAQPGLRQAEPGEFARRAFANGKMDLAQIEGLADLIDAETDWQRRQAQRQLSGALREAIAPWRAALIAASADVETAIDFSEDVALEASVHGLVMRKIAPIREGLRRELVLAPAAERIRDGVRIVIAGPPNAGKSTLLNALVRREAAIVSAIAGTTRDPIEVHLDLGGCPVTLVDTAGLRESGDQIEQIGIFRAREHADAADLVLWLAKDGSTAPEKFAAPVWCIFAKSDLRPSSPAQPGRGTKRSVVEGAAAAERLSQMAGSEPFGVEPAAAPSTAYGGPPPPLHGGGYALHLSARTGENLSELVALLTSFAQSLASSGASGLLARARHRQAFEGALSALDHLAAAPTLPIELIAEDLRVARFSLDRLIGNVDVEDILGDIFSRFCIGK